MQPGFIETDEDIAAGVKHLRRRCKIMRAVHDVAGHPPLRRSGDGLAGLARIVVGQQLSIASAGAIWTRTAALITPFTADRLAAATPAELKAVGLSAAKIRTLTALADEITSGRLDLERLRLASDEVVHEDLRRVVGIGPWTADLYLMFCLGRRDAFAPGDLALQIALQRAMALDAKPTATEIEAVAERWRPWRGVAARLLWAYYAVSKASAARSPV
jgi:DNA-3-methyladenine glycosylase II